MDNITHTLTGLMLSRCGLDRGEKHMTAIMLLAANAPDIDAYPFFTDSLNYLDIHRGYTHGLALAPLVALVPLAIVWGITKHRPSVWAWFAATIAVLSHILLDWTNVYGVRMLLPFSDRWLRLDITNVVDPIIWLILGFAAAVPALFRLVSMEIGSKKATGGRMGWAWVALIALVAYEGVRWDSHQRALGGLNALLYMDEPARKVYAFPDNSLATLEWRGLVEGDTFFYEMPVDFSGNFSMREARIDYKIGHAPTVDAAKQTRAFQVFGRFNQVPFWRISPLVDETRVDLLDLRFGSLHRARGFSATALVEPDGVVKESEFIFGGR